MLYFELADAAKIVKWAREQIKPEALMGDGFDSCIHTTVLYGFVGVSAKEVQQAVNKALSSHGDKTIPVQLGVVSKFANETDVIKIDVKSPLLEQLHFFLREEFQDRVECTYDTFVGHVTLAYVLPGSCDHLLGHAKFNGETYVFSHAVYSEPGSKRQTEIHFPIEEGLRGFGVRARAGTQDFQEFGAPECNDEMQKDKHGICAPALYYVKIGDGSKAWACVRKYLDKYIFVGKSGRGAPSRGSDNLTKYDTIADASSAARSFLAGNLKEALVSTAGRTRLNQRPAPEFVDLPSSTTPTTLLAQHLRPEGKPFVYYAPISPPYETDYLVYYSAPMTLEQVLQDVVAEFPRANTLEPDDILVFDPEDIVESEPRYRSGKSNYDVKYGDEATRLGYKLGAIREDTMSREARSAAKIVAAALEGSHGFFVYHFKTDDEMPQIYQTYLRQLYDGTWLGYTGDGGDVDSKKTLSEAVKAGIEYLSKT